MESCNYGHYGYDGDVNLGDCDNADFDEAFDAYIKEAVYEACDGSGRVLKLCCIIVGGIPFLLHTFLEDGVQSYQPIYMCTLFDNNLLCIPRSIQPFIK